MDQRRSHEALKCCAQERKNLVDQLRKCDWCSTSYESFAKCYQTAAKETGERSRACLI